MGVTAGVFIARVVWSILHRFVEVFVSTRLSIYSTIDSFVMSFARKNPSQQATLFTSWGSTNVDRTSVPSPSGELEDEWDEIPDDLLNDDFDEDQVVVQESGNDIATTKMTHVSHNNSSLIEDIPGFDYEAGQSYIYPINYPVRDYQFNIIKKCLYRNTLVSLPTGLGKTFIAAVVMYNFYRWYPARKVVFLAPTKPLVSQQVEACFNIMGKK